MPKRRSLLVVGLAGTIVSCVAGADDPRDVAEEPGTADAPFVADKLARRRDAAAPVDAHADAADAAADAHADAAADARVDAAVDAHADAAVNGADAADAAGAAARWVTGIWVGWDSSMHVADLDFGALTHLEHFALLPQSGGTLADPYGLASAAPALVGAAHAAHVKVLLAVGYDFTGAGDATHRAALIQAIVSRMTSGGYDGVEIDWESDLADYAGFIGALRTALDQVSPRPLLTSDVVANAASAEAVAPVAAKLDQINIQTYYLMDAWDPSLVSWHDAALTRTAGPDYLRTVASSVADYTAAGIAKSKIGIGISFNGNVWKGGTLAADASQGVTQPRQQWATAPTTAPDTSFFSIVNLLAAHPGSRVWDAEAHVPYLRIDAAGAANDMFVSYADEQSVGEKASYALAQGLGGVFLWQLQGGFSASPPAGYGKDPLLQAVKKVLRP